MKRVFEKKTVWLTAAAVLLVCCMSVGSAMAYFTTYASASGGQVISLGSETKIHETVSNWTKHITIENTGENECYIRVKVFAGSQFTLDYTDATGSWEQRNNDGYWYYKAIVPAGKTTEELLAHITVPDDQKSSFNVVVVQECTEVLYDASGNPYADWTKVIDTTTGISSGNGGGN